MLAGSDVRLAWMPELATPTWLATSSTGRTPRGSSLRIGSTTPPSTTFVDRAVPAGAYRYVVTAQDASASANESARSNEVSATVP